MRKNLCVDQDVKKRRKKVICRGKGKTIYKKLGIPRIPKIWRKIYFWEYKNIE